MQCLIVQLHPDRDVSFRLEDFLQASRGLGRYPEIDRSDDASYINLNYFSENVPVLWQQLQQGVFDAPELGAWARRVAIVVCEGDAGDELLLHHFDSSEPIDSF